MSGTLNSAQALVLGVLHSGPKSGADIFRIAETMEFWTFSRSQIYREVRHLENISAIATTKVNKRSDPLTLTPIGWNLYAGWLAEFPEDVEVQIKDNWYLRYRLAEHDGSDVAAVRAIAEARQRAASAIQRLQAPSSAQVLDAYHEAMAEFFHDAR